MTHVVVLTDTERTALILAAKARVDPTDTYETGLEGALAKLRSGPPPLLTTVVAFARERLAYGDDRLAWREELRTALTAAGVQW